MRHLLSSSGDSVLQVPEEFQVLATNEAPTPQERCQARSLLGSHPPPHHHTTAH